MSSNLVIFFFLVLNILILMNFSKIKFFYLNIDNPDKVRKFHSKPTPLAGGQIIFLNILIYWIFLNFFQDLIDDEIIFKNLKSFNIFMLISSIIFLIGFIDDRLNLKANLKFFLLFFAIFFLLLIDKSLIISTIKFSFYNESLSLNKFGIFFSIFCFLVFLNAFNMFDGINLQSSSYTIFIFICLLIFFSNSLFIKILILTLLSFSYLNYKNRTFLGDSGSLLIAFIISYFFIKLYNLNYIQYTDDVVLYMIIPGLDLIRLFMLRIFNKKNPLNSDRLHLQHLLISRYNLNKTLLIIITLFVFPVLLNYIEMQNIITIILTILVYSILLIYLNQKN